MTVGRDPGLQPERTRLAWRRTALALTVVAVLSVRLALSRGTVGLVVAVALLLVWGATLAVGRDRATGTPDARVGGRLALATTGLAVVGYALLGVLLVLTGLG